MKKIISVIFTLILIGVSIYSFYEYNFFIGVICLLWGISRLFGYNLNNLVQGLSTFRNNKNPNIQIEILFNIAEVLNHPIFDEIFNKIKNIQGDEVLFKRNKNWKEKMKNEDSAKAKKEWIGKIIENYYKKYGHPDDLKSETNIWSKVKFNIKNNILWRDDKVFFGDALIHEIAIPYDYKGDDEFSFNRFPDELQIRLQVVNGVMKLQVGNFDKSISPNILRKDGLAVYQTWYTVASLPLMYMDYGIPTHYLNPCAEAMDSFWEAWHGEKITDENLAKWKKEWRQINKAMRDYEYVSSKDDDNPLDNEAMKIIREFAKKEQEYRAKEGKDLKSNRDKSEDEGYTPAFLRDDSTDFTNKYLHISVLDYNSLKENKGKYAFSDYWEEHP